MSSSRSFEYHKWVSRAVIIASFIILSFVFMNTFVETEITSVLSEKTGKGIVGLIIVLALSADIFIPVPSTFIAAVSGAKFGLFWGSFFCWLGLTIGSLIVYFTGKFWSVKTDKYNLQLDVFSKRKIGMGLLVLAVCRAIPVLAETSVITAGTIGYPLKRFVPIMVVSNIGVSIAYCYIGIIATKHSPVFFAFLAVLMVTTLLYLLIWIFSKFSKTIV